MFYFLTVFSPSLATQAYLESKMNNCVIGKSVCVKRSYFNNTPQCLLRVLGKTMWILCVNGTEMKKLTSELMKFVSF